MATGELAMQGARASAKMEMAHFLLHYSNASNIIFLKIFYIFFYF